MAKQRTINIRDVWEVRIERYSGRFVLIFDNDTYVVRLHLSRYWVGHIAKKLWEFVKGEESAIQKEREYLSEGN